ncbi:MULTISPECIES: FAD-dependent monooxygenase [Sphingobium]|uniref:FAD-dependent monooxygenase n=1 Tax=Sphingobium sp. MI1205 TaxID=407020 RepID=UPI0007705B06|nr:FAD-dependent monooxygenase [Sphingobium sp. MI1205]AMK19579.1 hypothetical protein K663_16005 [Sphingobium sp. MI1205]
MNLDVPVLIAGGGPVGMTLALELARHQVRSILVERNPSTTRHPKMDLTNGRSMELYRRLGISDKLRAAAIPQDNAFDIMWATSPSGHLLHNFQYPSAAAKSAAMHRANDGAGTAESGVRISQIVLEPVLREEIDVNPMVEALFGWRFDSLCQDGDGVTSTIVNEETGETRQLRSLFLAGCDGGGSRVRRKLGIGLDGVDRVTDLMTAQFVKAGIDVSGLENIARMMMIHFRSPDRDILNPWGVAWHLQTGIGSMVAQDDIGTWTVHIPLPPGTNDDSIDAAAMLRQFVGRDFDFEILVANPWTPNLVIAERYIEGRVVLAGDAAHQVIPSGGYGMNTGVGDAIDLGWKLAAIVNGWAGFALLDSYEWERKLIAEQNRLGSEGHFAVRMQIADAYMAAMQSGHFDETGPEGEAVRAELARQIAALGNAENESWGIEHGYRYVGSPVVIGEEGQPPPFKRLTCVPTTFPGARLPHVVLGDGSFLIDRLGPELTLLVIGEADEGDFASTAQALDIPLLVVRLADEPALAVLERKLLLIRPDQHVAWRGNSAVPARAVLETATGRLASDVQDAGRRAVAQ